MEAGAGRIAAEPPGRAAFLSAAPRGERFLCTASALALPPGLRECGQDSHQACFPQELPGEGKGGKRPWLCLVKKEIGSKLRGAQKDVHAFQLRS